MQFCLTIFLFQRTKQGKTNFYPHGEGAGGMRHDGFNNSNLFFDIGEDCPYITELKTLKQLCVIKGDNNGSFRPKEYITREEAMIIAYRVIKLLQN